MSSNKEPVHKFETSVIPSYITSITGLFVYLSSSVHNVGIVKASLEQPLPLRQSKVMDYCSTAPGWEVTAEHVTSEGMGQKSKFNPPPRFESRGNNLYSWVCWKGWSWRTLKKWKFSFSLYYSSFAWIDMKVGKNTEKWVNLWMIMSFLSISPRKGVKFG